MKIIIFSLLSIIIQNSAAQTSFAQAAVVVYVEKKQEQRRSTRFTLTEWLRIKERMKLMDVWLAMFSSPGKDKFSPELAVSHNMLQGDLSATSTTSQSVVGSKTHARLFLKNLFTGTTGIKLLNIDLGIDYESANLTNPNSIGSSFDSLNSESDKASLNFRLIGDHIQDSSLVLKYGQVKHRGLQLSSDAVPEKTEGTMVGAEIELYLFGSLGLRGSFEQASVSSDALESQSIDSQDIETTSAGLFVEVSLLRITVEKITQEAIYWDEDTMIESSLDGWIAGMSLQM